MTTSAAVAEWVTGLDEVVARIATRFGRSEPRRRADRPKDRPRRAEAPIPDDGAFATKPMLGLATLAAVRKGAVGGMDLKSRATGLRPPTFPEIGHLIARPSLDRQHLFRRSEWRRRHQQRARRAHWTRRAWRPPQTRLSY